MSDFLRQLRSGGGKRFDRNRRPYDNSQYRGNDRYNGRDRKGPGHRKNYDHGQLQAIKKMLENIAEGQKTLAQLSERQALAAERIALALEAIGRKTGADIGDDVTAPVKASSQTTGSPPQPAELSPEADPVAEMEAADKFQAGGKPGVAGQTQPETGRESVMRTIQTLRKKGESFDKIAEYLESEQVPTLSGRGKWRAQSVSRLYNQTV